MNLSHTISEYLKSSTVLIRIKFDLKRCWGNVEGNMYPVSCKDDVEGKYGYGGFAQMMSWKSKVMRAAIEHSVTLEKDSLIISA